MRPILPFLLLALCATAPLAAATLDFRAAPTDPSAKEVETLARAGTAGRLEEGGAIAALKHP